MICFPNAKINLGLSIVGKRNDGMHNIETCIVPIPLFDILEIKQSHKFSIEQSGLQIPGGYEDNLITKVWKQLLSHDKKIKPVNVFLYKNIPVGSGLGGGSSDAIFFLKAINSYNALGLHDADMEAIAAIIGTDCPFFIKNAASIATGKGNMLTSISNPISNMYITILFPNIHISTVEAYSRIKLCNKSIIRDIVLGDISMWKNKLKNDFEEIINSDFPEISRIKNTLYNNGAIFASLTGSGSALYAISYKPLNIDNLKNTYSTWSVFIN